MSKWFDEEASEEAVKEYAQSYGIQTGEFLVTLKYCYILESSSSNAKAFKVEFEYESGKKGDAAFWFLDKNTGTQRKENGKPTFGSMQMAEFFGALEMSPNSIKSTDTKIKVFGGEKEMEAFLDLFDKTVRVVVQAKEEEHYKSGEIKEVPEVIGWFNTKTRLSSKEWVEKQLEPKAIESAIKRSTKLRKIKEAKESKRPAKDYTDADVAAAGW